MADEEQTPKPRAKKVTAATEASVTRARKAPATKAAAAKKAAVAKKAAAAKPAKAVDKTTPKSIVAGRSARPNAAKPVKAARIRPDKKGESPLDVLVYDSSGAHSGELRLPDAIFGVEPNMGVMHQALQRQLNNARQGNAATKTRGDVRGGGAKPHRQKGLGRARHGSIREPSMVGGGTVFGPHPRSFRQEMPRKMRRLALRSALSVKAGEGKVSVIDGFGALEVPKTRVIVDLLESLGVEGTALVVLASSNEMVARSAANLPWAKTILAHNLNLYDIFTHDHVVIAKDALELIEETFA